MPLFLAWSLNSVLVILLGLSWWIRFRPIAAVWTLFGEHQRGPAHAEPGPSTRRSPVAVNDVSRSGFDCVAEGGQAAHCTLYNVCVEGHQVKYYTSSDEQVAAGYSDGAFDLPPKMCSAADCADNTHVDISVQHTAAPEVDFDPRPYVLIRHYVPGNWGHTLGDDVFPTFQAQELWGIGPELGVVLYERSPSARLFRFLTTTDPLSAGPSFRKCFSRLISGWSHFGYASRKNVLPGASLNRFRDYVMDHLNVSWRAGPRTLTFTVLEKDMSAAEHRATIADAADFERRLLRLYPGAVVQRVRWSGVANKDQVQIMINTDVVISLPGSDIMNCIFLPPVSAMIIPHRRVSGSWEGSNEIDIWFRFAPHVYIRQPDFRDVPEALADDGIKLGGLIDKEVSGAVSYLCLRGVLSPMHCRPKHAQSSGNMIRRS
jgi:hypothetical protein